ncbi:PQQ-binding-like beta-propeller repeat protein [Micromonospora sp. NPDC000668]|uniref:PQQ-like beta-propeller repeat protein n=1 Tax=Micromonospora sp. NPDC000668 TaxID=3364219 RepID=UPI00368D65BC
MLLAGSALGLSGAGLGWLFLGSRTTPAESPPDGPGGFVRPTAIPATKGRWRAAVEASVRATPLRGDVDLYVIGPGGVVYALDLRTGTTRWQVNTGLAVHAGVGSFDGVLVVGGALLDDPALSGAVVGLDPAGKQLWRTPTPSNVNVASTLAAGNLIVGDSDGMLYGLDPVTGRPRWSTTVPGGDWGIHHLAAVGDTVLVEGVRSFARGQTGTFCAVNGASGELRWHGEVGAARWRAVGPGTAPQPPVRAWRLAWLSTASDGIVHLIRQRVVIAPDDPPDTIRYDLVAFNVSAGKPLWGTVAHRMEHDPLLHDGTLYLMSRERLDGPARIQALDARSGRERWIYRPSGEAAKILGDDRDHHFAVDSGVVCVGGVRGLIALSVDTGIERWHATVPEFSHPATPVAHDGVVYMRRWEDQVGGVWRWRIADGVAQPPIEPPSIYGELFILERTLYVMTHDALYSIDLPAG